MSELGDENNWLREELAAAASDLLPDLCTFVAPSGTETRDADGYVNTANADPSAEIPCELLPLTAREASLGSSVIEGATGKLRLPSTAFTASITGNYTGTILARGVDAARGFKVTGPLPASLDGWRYLAVAT